MRTVNNPQAPTDGNPDDFSYPELETFSVTLRNGTSITIREMTGKDLVYMEEELGDMKDTRRSFHIIERLNVGPNSLSYEEIENMGVRDIKAISELVAKANGEDLKDPK